MSTIHITIGTSQNGKACGTGDYEVGSQATIVATPNTNCVFVSWDDGVTLNPRTVNATANATYKAEFDDVTPASSMIRYNAPTAVSGNWVANNTDTTRNTYDSQTGNGVLYLNSGVTSIGGGYSTAYTPFYYKTDLVSVDITDSGLTEIGNAAFVSCSGLTSITIPNSVTTIGEDAFNICSSLTLITIPNSVTSIGRNAFRNCTGLASATIGSGVTTIGNAAFQDCFGLTSITIPNSVTSIGSDAFWNCRGLTSATIGSGVTTIGNYAFGGCPNLLEVDSYAPPPTLGTGNFGVTDNWCYVPTAYHLLYTTDTSWRNAFSHFGIIQ